MAEEIKDQVQNEEPTETVEETAAAEEHKSPVDEPYQVFSYKEPESFEYGGNYFVYGMACHRHHSVLPVRPEQVSPQHRHDRRRHHWSLYEEKRRLRQVTQISSFLSLTNLWLRAILI